MTTIGPSFASELKAAGIPLTGISWSTSGDIWYSEVSDTVKAQVATVLAVHDSAKPAVPQSITRVQGKIQLSRAGLLTQVETMMNAADEESKLWYTDASTWNRYHPKLLLLAAAMTPPIASDQIDAMFIAAGEVE